MALGDSYATLAELKVYMGSPASVSDTLLTAALDTASREIEKTTGRQFNKATSATARVYYSDTPGVVWPDEFHTLTDLAIKTDEGDDGTYETTWSSSDYQLEPLNGVVDGEQGWPYSTIRAVGSRLFPHYTGRRPPIQVTAQWGWNAVPAGVKQACLIMALEIHKMKDAPFGVAGFEELGAVEIRAAINPTAARLLRRYVRNTVLVA
jgi:hypothetical protein